MAPGNGSRNIDLGTDTPGKLGLTDPELNTITTPLLRIQGSQGCDIYVSSAINPAGVGSLQLSSWNDISGSGLISVDTLGLAASYGSAGVYGGVGGVINVNTAVNNIAAINTFTDNNYPYQTTSYPITITNTAPSGTLNIINIPLVDGIRNANELVEKLQNKNFVLFLGVFLPLLIA